VNGGLKRVRSLLKKLPVMKPRELGFIGSPLPLTTVLSEMRGNGLRVSFDWDDVDAWNTFYKIVRLQLLGVRFYKIKRSPGGKGFHAFGVIAENEHSHRMGRMAFIRTVRVYGMDDSKRVELDDVRMEAFRQVCFSRKGGFYV
jgi:hypothetical protein